jgi:Domain of unknown function (DUF4394)
VEVARVDSRVAHKLAATVAAAVVFVLAVPASAGAESAAYLLIKTNATPAGALVPFDINSPTGADLGAATAITGTGGERILGIDYRPTNGVLYGMSEASKLYAIDPATGAATLIALPGAVKLDPFTGVFQGIGFDFNPVADILRVVEDDGGVNGQDDNFSVDLFTGNFTQEGDIGGPMTDLDVSGLGYTNAVPGATQTTLYGIETNNPTGGGIDRLVVIDPPATGAVTQIDSNSNGLGLVIASQEMGFDITSSPQRGFATLQVGTDYSLYRIELRTTDEGNGTGDATLVGVLGSPGAQMALAGFAVRGFAIKTTPPPAPPSPPAPTPTPTPPPPQVDTTAPNTRISGGPKRRTRARSARFRFRSSEAGSTFQCKLDKKRFRRCRSPKRYRRLRPGKHTFRVRAIDAAGNVDRTPAVRRWRIVRG